MQSGQPRPLCVVVISALELLVAVSMLVISYQMAHGQFLAGASHAVLGEIASRAPYLAILAIVPAVLSVGLWLMTNWARILTIAIFGLWLAECSFGWAILAALYTSGAKTPTVVFNWLLLRTAYGWIVIYLLRPPVARAFREAY
jgi:hypothetical protein